MTEIERLIHEYGPKCYEHYKWKKDVYFFRRKDSHWNMIVDYNEITGMLGVITLENENDFGLSKIQILTPEHMVDIDRIISNINLEYKMLDTPIHKRRIALEHFYDENI